MYRSHTKCVYHLKPKDAARSIFAALSGVCPHIGTLQRRQGHPPQPRGEPSVIAGHNKPSTADWLGLARTRTEELTAMRPIACLPPCILLVASTAIAAAYALSPPVRPRARAPGKLEMPAIHDMSDRSLWAVAAS